ncbi:MAG: AAA family ATPase [Bacteroidetes bacterium]|nr:AAA family ATPase [Bacteroidota bacterium]
METISEDYNTILEEAYEHLRQGRYRMALTSAKKVYEENSDDFNAASCLAWAYLENGEPAEALEMANYAVEIGGDDVNPRLYRGYMLMRMSVFEGAIADLDWTISKKPNLLSWAHLNKAKALAGLGRYFEGLEEIEKAIKIDKKDSEKLLQIKKWLQITLGYGEGFLKGIFSKKRAYLKEGLLALKQKEYWLSLWSAKKILDTPSLKGEFTEAYIMELESLFGMFQFRQAHSIAEELKPNLSGDKYFDNIYQRILKAIPQSDIVSAPPVTVQQNNFRTNFEESDNRLYKILSAKTYNLTENLRTNKRTYLLEFNEDATKYIGVEVVSENPFYSNKTVELDGLAVWKLNGVEVGSHQFLLTMEKDWKIIEFTQSWGTETPGFWSRGQGSVDIHLDNQKVCTRWFAIGGSDVVNFEDIKYLEEDSKKLEMPDIKLPEEVIIEKPKPIKTESLKELLDDLDNYVGLESVKESMKDFVAYLEFIRDREKSGLKTDEDISVNSIFLGNPGTGKTTIARLMGKIFKAMGLLKNGHVIEVDRTSLVGQYIGATAQMTEKVINESIGGLLFIDEAYTLIKPDNPQDFGQEAIDVLLKRMEDRKGEFVVIAAGYPDKMQSFINSNPGLKSRFTRVFYFDDYTPDQLQSIFELIAEKEDYEIKEDAKTILKKELISLYRKRDESFGNARLVRQIFNESKIQLSKRYLTIPTVERTKEVMSTICSVDIEAALKTNVKGIVNIGIDEDNLKKALDKLNDLCGLDSIKREINELVKLARLYCEQGENLLDKFSSHFVFLGSPGTGKTTVARIFSEIYSALGILPKGHLVETDRHGLVAGYIGQTAQKTTEMIDKAIGGTLLIDEAYSLVKTDNGGSDFGQEAIDTLLKRMEDDKGRFVVIAAGYTEEMRSFLKSNPGLKSRFTKELVFDDFTPGELLEIMNNYIEMKGHKFDKSAIEPLVKYFNETYRTRDKSFGNARLVRNISEEILRAHLLRIADIPSEKRNDEIIEIITKDDIEKIVLNRIKKTKVNIVGDADLLNKHLNELSELTGLENVKKSVEKLISSLKVAKLRKERGLQVIPKNLHSVFMGNPGTGKTTIARLLSKIYKEMGILEKGHLVEVDRTGLVAGFVGQTAAKTEAVIENAFGGTLFIDEAYSLARGGNDFGQEAIETLIKRMEDYKGKFVVIVAGYTNEMKEFIDSNPGLQSRFTNYFSFEDYTPRQMLEIALVISSKNGYQLDEGAWQLFLDTFTKLYDERDKNFGNARTVRNILYKAISNQEERILTLVDLSDEDLTKITFEDVEKIDYSELK